MQKRISTSLFVGTLFLALGCGRENPAGGPNPIVEPAKITNFEQIKSERNKKSLLKQSVNIGNIQVADLAPSDYVFLAGDAASTIPVLRFDKKKAEDAKTPITYHVRRSDKIRVVGFIKDAATEIPAYADAKDRALLGRSEIYIEAHEVTFVSR